ncbi:hypothetical protein [Streptomyces hesseae]|uniref:Uncharacterized protein n=1 Tax=Streptomyces hesseae TaxID=3075519 RepID=A0ABU2SHP0_9ACTN|nr:hypothetical protein [Streptomyces sp. DSM 40473]MDT0448497.1 hypothetical protein [Streptomyces sp. DSM 40473]
MAPNPVGTADRPTPSAESPFERVRAVADAVLYEGYLLYPYRRSSGKNRVRWQFGVLAPRDWTEAQGPETPGVAGSADSWRQRTECLVRATGPDPMVRVRVRFLQVRRKRVERRTDPGRHAPVDALEVAGTVHLPFDEAVPRECDIAVPLTDLLAHEREFAVGAPGGTETEELGEGAGRVLRQWLPLRARTLLRAERLDTGKGLFRLRVRTENTGAAGPRSTREEALRHALIATHTVIGGDGLCFLSLLDPPPWARPYAEGCRNLHTFPVLAGEPGACDLVLSSPIILPDHPQVAPESPGDLHDAAEIDEILTLRTLLLTDEEKREARATDRRAAEILDRVDTMPPEVFGRLHGAIRSLTPRPDRPDATTESVRAMTRAAVPWWREGGDEGLSPATDSVLVDGVAVAAGGRVLLCPRGRGADAQDMFLAGRAARVAGVFHDVDGSVRLAVTIEDDPAAELHDWYGRFHYFRPDEVRPLATTAGDRVHDRARGRTGT